VVLAEFAVIERFLFCIDKVTPDNEVGDEGAL
jgi:hypothetical protein